MITDFASLKLALNDWTERGYTDAKLEEAIALAEAAIRRELTGYQREESYTFATDAEGYSTLPTGFLGVRYIDDANGYPARWEVTGTRILISGDGNYYAGSFDGTIYSTLLSLSASNTTNWLIDIAPDAYLWMTQSQLYAFGQEWGTAAAMASQAAQIISSLNLQNTIAQYGRNGSRLPVQAV
jgi:hypothetical protein